MTAIRKWVVTIKAVVFPDMSSRLWRFAVTRGVGERREKPTAGDYVIVIGCQSYLKWKR